MALSTISGTTGITDATITSAKLADFSAAVDLNGVELLLDADQDTSITADTDDRIDFKIAGVEHISISNSSGDTIIKPMVNAKDIVFQQYDGNKILEINDGNYVAISGAAAGPGELRFYEDTDLGSHYTGFKAGNATASVSYVLPLADGTDGYQLSTDGSGTLSWAAAGTTLANDANNRVVTGTGSGLNGEANLTFDGSTLAVTGAATVSGALTGSGTVQGTTITATTAFVPDASDGAALGTSALEFSDLFLADAAVISLGDDDDVTITHVHDTGILINSTNVIQFNDASQNIGAPSNAILDINATDEIELNATLVDINANVEISGTATTTGVHTFTAVPVFPNNTVESADIQADAITGAKIADNAIDSEHYTDGSIDNAHIADDAIDSEHYAAGSIDTAHIAADQIVASLIADNAIDSEHYTDGSIDNAHIADDAIDSEHYAAGSIDTAHIAADQIVASLIADNAIDSEHYTDGSIDNAHIADDAIDSEHYAAGSIDEAHIADAAVAVAKIKITGETQLSAAPATGDELVIYDASATANKRINVSNFLKAAAVTALNSATANELVTVGSTTTELDAEANLLFNGYKLSTGGETAPDVHDGGITLNLAANAGPAISIKSSDVAHGITAQAETDTYTTIKRIDANGGVLFHGFTESYFGMQFESFVTNQDTNRATDGSSAIKFNARLKSGTSVGALTGNNNILSIGNDNTQRFFFDTDGDFHADSSSTTFDAYDDAQLVRAYDLSHGNGTIDSKFDKFIAYNHEHLADLKLVGRERDGTPNNFVNVTGMQRLHNGAIWQQYEKHNQLLEAVYDLAKVAVGEEKANAILDKHEVKRLN